MSSDSQHESSSQQENAKGRRRGGADSYSRVERQSSATGSKQRSSVHSDRGLQHSSARGEPPDQPVNWTLRPPGLVIEKSYPGAKEDAEADHEQQLQEAPQLQQEAPRTQVDDLITLRDVDPYSAGELTFSEANPVVLQTWLYGRTRWLHVTGLQVVTSESGEELLKCKFELHFFWNDPRLIDWPEDVDPPLNVWRPELGMLDGVKNMYLEENKAAILAMQGSGGAVVGDQVEGGGGAGEREGSTSEDGAGGQEEEQAGGSSAEKPAGAGRGAAGDMTIINKSDDTTTAGERENNKTGTASSDRQSLSGKSSVPMQRRNSVASNQSLQSSAVVTTNPHAEIPNPKFYNGNQGRKSGRLYLQFPLESHNLDMLEDKERLDFLVILSGEKRVETADKVCFYWGAPESKFQNCSVLAPTTAAEFDLVGVSYAKGVHVSVGTGLKYEDVCFSLHFSRVVVYYIHKGVFPLSACIFFGYSAFAITPEELGGRLQLLVAVFLTCFAIQWIITERLPRVPYLTILDHIVFASVVSLCVTACGMCVAYGIGAGRHFTREHAGGSLEQFDMETARLIDLCVAGALFLLQAAWALSIFVLRIQGGLRNFLAVYFPACCVPGILAGLRFCSTGMWGLLRALGFLLWSGPRQMCRASFSLLLVCGTSCCDRSSGKRNKSAGRGGGRSVGPMLGSRTYAGAGAGAAGSGAELKRLLEDEDMHASATLSSTSSPTDKEKDSSSNKEEMKKEEMKQLTRFGTRTWASGETIKHQFIVPQTFQAFHMVRRADGKFAKTKEQMIMGLRGHCLDEHQISEF